MSALYPTAKKKFLDGAINLTSDTIRVLGVDTDVRGYTAGDEFVSSVTAASRVTNATALLSGKTTTNGVFDAADVTFTAAAVNGSANDIKGLVIYKDTGTATTSPVIAFIDQFTAVTVNGTDVTITWDNGANKIFALV